MNEFDKVTAKLDKRLAKLEQERLLFDKRSEIREKKKAMRIFKPPTTTKVIMAVLFLNCTIIELYSMAAMWYLANLDALYTLITAVVGETVSFAVYAAKAFAETKEEEAIKLERDMMEMEAEEEEPEEEADDTEAFG